MADKIDEHQVWEKGDSRRSVNEVGVPLAAWGGDQEVVYALYRRQKIWRKPDEWWFLRYVRCRLSTFEKWARGATRLQYQNKGG